MKDADYREMRDEAYTKRTTMADGKAQEYASETDRLTNFKEVGRFLGLSPLKVAGVYMFKHIRAIFSYIKNEGTGELSEPIDGRIDDAQEYMDLVRGLITELKNCDTIGGNGDV
jgi:hypothetical protein